MGQPRVQFPTAEQVPGQAVAGPAPTATLDGTIAPPSLDWDPYATPGVTQPTLVPNDPYLSSSQPGLSFAKMRRLLEEVRLDYVWMPGTTTDELGINDVELSGTFAIPCFANLESSLLVTPGFAVNFWNGPVDVDFPPQTFDAYLDTAWQPKFTPWFGADLAFRVGVYSDFRRVTAQSLRYTGRGIAVISYSPSFKFKLGIMYLDRVRVKILPAVGIYWAPNPDIYFDVFFPEPKIAMRLCNIGNTEWWGYMRGEYGGGSWTVRRDGDVDPFIAPGDFAIDQADYNDMRFALGLEFTRMAGLGIKGLFEVGLSFDREMRFRTTPPKKLALKSTVFLRAGLAY